MYTEHIMYDLNEDGIEVGYDAESGMYVVCDANDSATFATKNEALNEAKRLIAEWASER